MCHERGVLQTGRRRISTFALFHTLLSTASIVSLCYETKCKLFEAKKNLKNLLVPLRSSRKKLECKTIPPKKLINLFLRILSTCHNSKTLRSLEDPSAVLLVLYHKFQKNSRSHFFKSFSFSLIYSLL